MIVSANRSGVLEFFWRHRAISALFRLTPADFRSARTRHSDVQYLREWLSVQPGCESVRDLDDPRVVKRVADAVRSGEIVLLEPPAGPRLPGTGVEVSSLYGPLLLLAYRKLSQASDLSYALEWAATVSEEDLTNVRAIVTDNDDFSRFNDEAADIRSELIELLKAGELIPFFTYYPTSAFEKLAELPSVQPPDLKRSEPADPVEAPTFDPDHLVMAQAAAMMSASESGAAFCEVCNKAR
jgi:hypothetical protein